jgi:hypothetical protein
MTVRSSEAEIFHHVGRCLAEWSRIEFGLAVLFCLLNDRKPRANDPLLASFEVVRSFEIKQSILRALVASDERIDDLFRERYGALDKKIGRMARRRAEIAHFSIVRHYNEKSPAGLAMLHPFHTYTGMFFETNRRPLSGNEIKTCAKAFSALADRVFRYVVYMQNVRGLLEPFDQPEVDPRHLLHSAPDRRSRDFVLLP